MCVTPYQQGVFTLFSRQTKRSALHEFPSAPAFDLDRATCCIHRATKRFADHRKCNRHELAPVSASTALELRQLFPLHQIRARSSRCHVVFVVRKDPALNSFPTRWHRYRCPTVRAHAQSLPLRQCALLHPTGYRNGQNSHRQKPQCSKLVQPNYPPFPNAIHFSRMRLEVSPKSLQP